MRRGHFVFLICRCGHQSYTSLEDWPEARALSDHYRTRALLQAQAGAELRTLATDQAARIAALEAELTALLPTADTPTIQGDPA